MLISENQCILELRLRMVELNLTGNGISVEGYEDKLFNPSSR